MSSGGKKRSGFQITSVTSDFNQSPAGQSAPSAVLTVLQSAVASCRAQGSSSQPTTPSLKRKHVSHDALGQALGASSRFRVVKLAVGGAGSSGRGQPISRGRWTCTDVTEQQEGAGFRRVMDTMRHAHSLESLETIGRDRGRVHSHDHAHLLAWPIRGQEGAGLMPRSGPSSPTHQQPMNIRVLDWNKPMGAQGSDLAPPTLLTRPPSVPPPLRLDVDSAGRRRPPSTPPLPLRTLKLVAKQPEAPVVLRDRRKVKGQASGVRDSWPGAGRTTSEPKPKASQRLLTPPSWGRPITEALVQTTNQPQPRGSPAVWLQAAPHWSAPVRAPLNGRGSDATMMSLLLLCHRYQSHLEVKGQPRAPHVESHYLRTVQVVWVCRFGLLGSVCLSPVCLSPVCLSPVCLSPVCLSLCLIAVPVAVRSPSTTKLRRPW
ncbi:TSC22 domain family protein 4 [Liparis tanakae]|uniref:TSC22 domain family protein 4 n=1 Tax=Liparis tanakae TaxID=230148 RepID=A0A4Z2GC21_9TELE|nr:TSC22 domain family protein 4 [Liparis tanakae]